MPFVEFYKLRDDGTQEVIARCTLEENEVFCEGDPILTESLSRDGIFDYTSPIPEEHKLYPKDGRKFLEQLKFSFKSGYLNASDVKE